ASICKHLELGGKLQPSGIISPCRGSRAGYRVTAESILDRAGLNLDLASDAVATLDAEIGSLQQFLLAARKRQERRTTSDAEPFSGRRIANGGPVRDYSLLHSR